MATAHKIARTFYHVRKHREPFHDYGAEEYEKRARARETTALRKKAIKLGMTLVELPPTASTA